MVESKDELVILWTSGEKEVALNMVFMYALNAKRYNWWKSVRLVIWGASTILSAKNDEIKEGLKELKNEGVVLEACKACAKRYGVVGGLTVISELEDMGIDVKYMGEPLTSYIKGEQNILTF